MKFHIHLAVKLIFLSTHESMMANLLQCNKACHSRDRKAAYVKSGQELTFGIKIELILI